MTDVNIVMDVARKGRELLGWQWQIYAWSLMLEAKTAQKKRRSNWTLWDKLFVSSFYSIRISWGFLFLFICLHSFPSIVLFMSPASVISWPRLARDRWRCVTSWGRCCRPPDVAPAAAHREPSSWRHHRAASRRPREREVGVPTPRSVEHLHTERNKRRVTLNTASDYRTNGLYRTPNPNPNPIPIVT